MFHRLLKAIEGPLRVMSGPRRPPKGAAETLGFIESGIAKLRVTVMGAPRAE
jgi:hypothetical protein